MNDSYLATRQGQISAYIGPDAMALAQAKVLIVALKAYDKHKVVLARGVTPTRLLALASGITRKPYKRGQYLQAAADVALWAKEMEASLPVEER